MRDRIIAAICLLIALSVQAWFAFRVLAAQGTPAPLPCTGHCVQLQWNEVSGATDGYIVLKSYLPCWTPSADGTSVVPPGNFIRAGVTADTAYLDKTVKPGTSQCYIVVSAKQLVNVPIPSGDLAPPVVIQEGSVSAAVQ
jgi:hypothetical protein